LSLLIATANPAKAREFREMLADGAAFTDLSAFPAAIGVKEIGHTFLQNACIKAIGYARQTGAQWTLADDSGLEVDALGGAPGVYSARYAARRGLIPPSGNTDAENNAALLRDMAEIPDERRQARFVCVLALADSMGQIVVTVRRTIEGVLLREPRGNNGFGYDPLFFVPKWDKTTAELAPADKNRISHRGQALAGLSEMIAERKWPIY
jgi:XTP/dITP diphosphohydrolase